MNDITITGNVVYDPERRAASGKSWVTFRVAHNHRHRDLATGEWVDGEPTFIEVSCWRALADNVATSVVRGMPVLVTGRLRSRETTTESGDSVVRRTYYSIEAESVGLDLRFTAVAARPSKSAAAQRQEDVAIAEATGSLPESVSFVPSSEFSEEEAA